MTWRAISAERYLGAAEERHADGPRRRVQREFIDANLDLRDGAGLQVEPGVEHLDPVLGWHGAALEPGAYTRPMFSST